MYHINNNYVIITFVYDNVVGVYAIE
jgi:hypothetical protein